MTETEVQAWLDRGRDIQLRIRALDGSGSAGKSERKRLEKIRKEITEAVSRVRDNRMAALLQLRYVNGMTWEEIALQLHYSPAQVWRLHKQAIRKIKDEIE